MSNPRRVIIPAESIRRPNNRTDDLVPTPRPGGTFVTAYLSGQSPAIHIDYLDDDSTPAPSRAIYVAVKTAGPLGPVTVLRDFVPPGKGKDHWPNPPDRWHSHTPGAGRVAPGALTLTLLNTPGNIDPGRHNYAYTILTLGGESTLSPSASVSTAPPRGQVTVAGPNGDSATTGYNVYRTKVGGGQGAFFLLRTITGPVFTSFTDNVADANLGAAAP